MTIKQLKLFLEKFPDDAEAVFHSDPSEFDWDNMPVVANGREENDEHVDYAYHIRSLQFSPQTNMVIIS